MAAYNATVHSSTKTSPNEAFAAEADRLRYVEGGEAALDEAMTNEVPPRAAWAVVMDVRTGEILAMASRPSFAVSAFGSSSPEEQSNRAISTVYEPGSVMKTFAAAAALDEGLVATNTLLDVSNTLYCGRPLRDHTHGHDELTVAQMLNQALVGLPEYEHIGRFLRSYQVDKLDEAASLAKGVVDGKTVYIDSVFYSTNPLLGTYDFGVLNGEDSTYWALIPEKELWDSLYAEAETYFNYVGVDKPDSLHELYSHYALMQDLFYNPKAQHNPSRYFASTPWVYSPYETEELFLHHVYYDVFDEGGLFHPGTWSGSQQCSNGWIYRLDKWPFTKEHLYFYPLINDIEGCLTTYEEGVKTKKLTAETVATNDSRVTYNYMTFTPQTQTDPYFFECEIGGVKSGTYDVYVIFLPRDVNPTLPFDESTTAGKRNLRPAKFKAEITYQGLDGKSHTVDCKTHYKIDPESDSYYVKGSSSDPYLFDCNVNPTNANTRAFINDPLSVDSVKLCSMTFPTCSYALSQPTTRVKIINAITNQETNKYWGVWFVDRIVFKPHTDTEAGN